MAMLQCYNKGCGQKYNPDENSESACQYHPGTPVFHDALKGWSCCSKRSTDFTQFLNFKGCTSGPHSNVKPPEPEKPEKDEADSKEIIVVEGPKPVQPRVPSERPPSDEPMVRLKTIIGASLKTELEKLKLEGKEADTDADADSQVVAVGTQCKNNACKCTYNGPESNDEDCLHHPGYPVFHEGMKFWTCCMRKTSDFDNFLNQEGCKTGKHLWIKTKEQRAADAQCRVDWHQTGPNVCLSIFAKVADPELSYVEANKVMLKASIVFNKGNDLYQKTFHLRDVIKPECSEVKMLGTKVEVNLRKAAAFPWPSLEMPKEDKEEKKTSEDGQ